MTSKVLFVISSIALCVLADNSPAVYSRFKRSIDYTSCEKPGLSCSSCQRSEFCLEFLPGQSVRDYEECPEDTTCKDGKCTKDFNKMCDPSVTEWAIVWQSPGMYPHPYDCTKYYICSPDNSTELTCDKGYGYDPLSTICNVKLTDGICGESLPICKGPGEKGPVGNNPYMYFACLPNENGINIINFLRCSNGQRYTGDTKSCENDEYLDKDDKCTKVGKYYTKECNKYIECTADGEPPAEENCDPGYKFNAHKKDCELAVC